MRYVTMIMDFQYGSTGKGLIAGYLAERTTLSE
jgi:adenylosuccinate synthase